MKVFAQIIFTVSVLAVYSSVSSANSRCAQATRGADTALARLVLDKDAPQIPLYQVPPAPMSRHPLYMGYEVLKTSEPIFKNPEKFESFSIATRMALIMWAKNIYF